MKKIKIRPLEWAKNETENPNIITYTTQRVFCSMVISITVSKNPCGNRYVCELTNGVHSVELASGSGSISFFKALMQRFYNDSIKTAIINNFLVKQKTESSGE